MPKPNKENIITAILEELGKNTSWTDCFSVILRNFTLSRPTFDKYWKEANELHKVTQNEAQTAIKEQSIAMQVEAAKNGLKSRLEYCREIQALLDNDVYEESVLDLKSGKVTRYHRKLTPLERKALYERISKFEGMDAPLKVADTTVDGKDKQQFIELPNGTKIPL